MISNKAIKIFVEPDEEIVFIVEKILSASSGRVILIVPNTAVLISSAVSLKMLAKQVVKTDKLIVLVSDTNLAKSLGNKAKLMVCAKVSEVSKEVWQMAQEQKTQFADELNRVKQELLSVRQEPLGDPLRVEDLLKKVLPKQSDTKSGAVGLAPKTEKVKAVLVDEPEKQNSGLIIKPRLKERVMDINGIKLVAGGDILNNDELVEMERGRLNQVLALNLKKEDNDAVNNLQKEDMYKDTGFVGMDMTRQLSSSPYTDVNRMNQKPKEFPAFFKKIQAFFQGIFKYVSFGKFALGLAIAFIVFFAVSYFFMTSAKVEVEQSTANFSIKKTITAKVDDDKSFDVATLVMPARSITKDSTISSEADATGEGSTGEYAQGDLLIYNPTASSITIKAGQVFSYNYNAEALKYKALQEVVVPSASTVNSTVKVKAESFGEKYNITSTLKSFLIEGITGVTAQNFTAITGGTTVAAKMVSKENIEDLKQSMTEQLKVQLLTALKSTLGEDDIFFTGTEKFTENSYVTSVKEGTAIDKFSADLKMTVSAVIISKTELKQLLTEVGKTENGYSKVEIKDPVVENIKLVDKVATFDTRVNAVGMNEINLDQIKQDIKGLSVTEAKEKIKAITGVSNVYVQFNPPYIPIGMQKIPSDDAKLTVTGKMKESK